MKKYITSIILAIYSAYISSAQETSPSSLVDEATIQARLGFEYQGWDGMTSNDNTGFKGKYLLLNLSGHLAENLSYQYRQRLDKIGTERFFDGTEIMNVTWQATQNINLSIGKQQIAMGGFEYNTNSIDLYYSSEFWNLFPMYQLGASLDVNIGHRDNIMIQVANSPLRYNIGNNMYAAALKWSGHHGFYSSLWSVNVAQFRLPYSDKERFLMNYVSLGNKFTILPDFYVSIDLMNRMDTDEMNILKDYTISSEISAKPITNLRTYAKYTRDVNQSNANDFAVIKGTEINTASAGVEFEPLKRHPKALRVYASGMYSWGENNHKDGFYFEKELRVEAGVKVTLGYLPTHKNHQK